MGSRIEPGEAAAHSFHNKPPFFEVLAVEVGDLVFAASGRLEHGGLFDDIVGVEVEADYCVVGFGLRRLLFERDCAALSVELHDAIALWVADAVAEDRWLVTRSRLLEKARQIRSIEDIVAKNKAGIVIAEKLAAENKGLSESVRDFLNFVGELHSKLRAVAEEPLEVRQIGGCRDYQHFSDVREHQGGKRIVDHRLVVDRQKLL